MIEKFDVSNFKTLIKNKQIVIDKSSLIRWVTEHSGTIFLCGEHWGKSINLSMIKYFYSQREENQKALFQQFSIAKNPTYQKLQGNFPVLLFDFSGIKPNSTRQQILDAIIDEVKLLYIEYDEEIPTNLLKNLGREIRALMGRIQEKHGKPCVVLVDGYDKPMQIAYYSGCFNEITNIMDSFLSFTFKGNTYLFSGFLTGNSRPGNKFGWPSNFNNFSVYSMFNKNCASFFGFDQDDVRAFFKAHDLALSDETLKQLSFWYGGYYVYGIERFNPQSIRCYVQQLKEGNAEFNVFFYSEWQLIKSLPSSLVTRIGNLLKNKEQTLSVPFSPSGSTYFPESEKDEETLLNLLLFNQFLTPIKSIDQFCEGDMIELTLPNQEMACFFEELLVKHYGWNKSCLSKQELYSLLGEYCITSTDSSERISCIVQKLSQLINQNDLVNGTLLVENLRIQQSQKEAASTSSLPLTPAKILSKNFLRSPVHTDTDTKEILTGEHELNQIEPS